MSPDESPLPAPVALDRRPYSRAEFASDMIVHLAALALAVGAVPVLITLTAVWRGDAAGIAGVSIYGATLILMLMASLLYNHVGRPRWSALFRRLDMSAIHLKIAGTYTPFALLSGAGSGLLTVIWTAAAGAMALTLFVRSLPSGVAVGLCLGLGWAVVIGGQDIIAALPISIGGLGVRENTLVRLFFHLGITREVSTATILTPQISPTAGFHAVELQ